MITVKFNQNHLAENGYHKITGIVSKFVSIMRKLDERYRVWDGPQLYDGVH